jgi:hypothetical protein
VGGEAPVTPVSSLDSSSLDLSYKPCDNITGRVPFTEGFLSSGYQLGFSALLISLEFFPHTCNNSSKVVNDVLVGLSFGNYYRESL